MDDKTREILKAQAEYWFGVYMDLKEELDSQIESQTIKGEQLQQALFHINAAQDLIRYIIDRLKEEK